MNLKPGDLIKLESDFNLLCGYGVLIRLGKYESRVLWLDDLNVEVVTTRILEKVDT